MSERIQGKVKWFNLEKGYGFLQPASGGSDVFVHISEVERSGLRTLKEDQAVTFTIQNHKGKNSAADIQEAA